MKKAHNGFESKTFPTRKQAQRKRHPLDLSFQAKVSDRKPKILTTEQMFQILPRAVSSNHIFFVSTKRNYWNGMLKYNEASKDIMQSGYYIYEFYK